MFAPDLDGDGNPDVLSASFADDKLAWYENTEGDAGAQVVFGTPATFFVVVTPTSDANGQTPHEFQVTHLTKSSNTAEDRTLDIPLLLEYAANVSSHSVLAASLSLLTNGRKGFLDAQVALPRLGRERRADAVSSPHSGSSFAP